MFLFFGKAHLKVIQGACSVNFGCPPIGLPHPCRGKPKDTMWNEKPIKTRSRKAVRRQMHLTRPSHAVLERSNNKEGCMRACVRLRHLKKSPSLPRHRNRSLKKSMRSSSRRRQGPPWSCRRPWRSSWPRSAVGEQPSCARSRRHPWPSCAPPACVRIKGQQRLIPSSQ